MTPAPVELHVRLADSEPIKRALRQLALLISTHMPALRQLIAAEAYFNCEACGTPVDADDHRTDNEGVVLCDPCFMALDAETSRNDETFAAVLLRVLGRAKAELHAWDEKYSLEWSSGDTMLTADEARRLASILPAAQ